MSTFRLVDNVDRESEDFEAPDLHSAVSRAIELLADWWKYADPAEHPLVSGTLYEVDEFDIITRAFVEARIPTERSML